MIDSYVNDRDEHDQITFIIEKIWKLLQKEIDQQLKFNNYSHSALQELDEYLKTFENSNSVLQVITVLRTTFTAKSALKNWIPLLEIGLKKWPPDNNAKNMFVGLNLDIE